MLIYRALVFFMVLILTNNNLFALDYNIKDFGAVPDGETLNTKQIQAAIDQAASDGGGRVIIPKGRYLTGSLLLKSMVELHLSKGSIILGSLNINDYYAVSKTTATYNWKSLILANTSDNIIISGKGVIDGQGGRLALKIDSLFYAGVLDSTLYQLKEKRPMAHARPQILQFVKCQNIKITGITIKNSASWVQTYDLCNKVEISNISVVSVSYWNNDGIDIIDSRNVKITHCNINSSDDGICLKSYKRRNGITAFCDSIYISECTVRSSASAVKLGTSSYGGFKNIVIENIKVYDTYRSALALEMWEPGILENILVQNIKVSNTGNAIFVRLGQREVYNKLPPGKLRNVVIKNVKATIPYVQPDINYELRGPAEPFFHNTFPVSITGIPNYRIENLTLENIKIVYPGRGNPAYANMPINRISDVPEKIGLYPEFSMFGELPSWGMYIRHVNGLTIKNMYLKIKEPDYRPALLFDDVKNLSFESYKILGDKKLDLIIYHNTKH
ncbi:MAG: polygalacturonase [Bacteroidia bacterium]|jgi:polygalacturonase